MNLYECITIIDAGLTDEAITEATQKIEGIITNGGGEIKKTDPWGRRKLAYETNRHTRGFYTLFVYSAPADLNEKLEKTFKVYDPVFKYMIVRLEKKQAAATLKAIEEENKAPAEETPTEAKAAAEAAPETAPATEETAPAETTTQE